MLKFKFSQIPKCFLSWNEFPTSFSSLPYILTVLWKKNTLTHPFLNHYSKQNKHSPQDFSYGQIRGEGLPLKPKGLNFPFLLDRFLPPPPPPPPKKWVPPSLPWSQTTYWKRGISIFIAFRQILPAFLPTTSIFSYTIITYSKNSLELNL